jgi:phenylacetate-CoA ligase
VTERLSSAAQRLPDGVVDTLVRLLPFARPFRRRAIRSWMHFIASSEAWSEDELAAYQLARLRSLIEHAYAHVPHYRRVFDDLGAEPEDFNELADLHRLPTLDKTDLQERFDDLLADNVSAKDRSYYTTAGSTGIPVGFYYDAEQGIRELAFMRTQWARVGFREHDRRIVLRGTVVAGDRMYERSLTSNELVMSSYHLTDDRIPLFLERIRTFRPSYIHAYPSSVSMLARSLLELGEPPIEGLRAVLCGSENLYDWQRGLIEEAFQCRVYSWYGQSEGVCLAGECEHDTRLHIFPQYGLAELVDDDGAPVTEPGRPGEIVATGLHARAMPLIRYRTKDVATFASGTCELCGRPYRRFERIEGRLQEFIVTAGGRRISMVAINMHSSVFDNVRQFRFYQDEPGRVVLKLVPRRSFSWDEDVARIRRELAPKLGPDCSLEVELVTDIARGGRGKHHFIDQKLATDLRDRA